MTRAVVVGSGPNGLAAALTLASRGVEVVVHEAADAPGGAVRSSELTEPGLLHDEGAGFHPFATSSVFARAFDLEAAGLRWAHHEVVHAQPLDGGRGGAAVRSLEDTAASLGPDAAQWRAFFGPVVERFDTISDEFLQPVTHVPRHPLHLARLGLRAPAPAALTGRLFRTEEARGLWAGLAAHGFTSFRMPLSSAIGTALGAAAHRFGWPVAVGGSGAITAAVLRLLESYGGRVETGSLVTDVRDLGPADITMLDTSPAVAADIASAVLPERTVRAYRRFRHGAAAFQLAVAVEGGIPWAYEPARRAGTVHLGGTLAQTAAAEAEVARGRMPRQPFVLLGQQHLADPGRARDGLVPIDCYAHVPAGFTGDATEAVLDQVERFAPGFRRRVVRVVARSTQQIERDNPNFGGGDIVTGHKSPVALLLGPRPGPDPYATGAPGTYLCSAAAPPGPGAHGVGGHLAALRALERL